MDEVVNCKNCMHCGICPTWNYYDDEPYKDGEWCGGYSKFKSKSRSLELPLSLEDRENLEKALRNIYLYRLYPIDCKSDNCPKFDKDKDEVCQEMSDVYAGKHPKYRKTQDWEFMCDCCPLGIEKVELTPRRYEEALRCKQGKIPYIVNDLIPLLSLEDAQEKLKEVRDDANITKEI